MLECILKVGVRWWKNKCTFLWDSVTYLGHQQSKEGIKSMPEKIPAIFEASDMTSVTAPRKQLGLLNYYGKFLAHLASLLHLLSNLLGDRGLGRGRG
ncbi:hypothetical protein G0U57_016410 [Chelydra serpentina]|uniref:Uncharacterized protein n=1 Tax=Chelydra serpentina TaxID=8475 RepID=A0A8T1S6W7_CHESE|nr:hypothetical protein G0U57_016410 [Chelydra serpentina]